MAHAVWHLEEGFWDKLDKEKIKRAWRGYKEMVTFGRFPEITEDEFLKRVTIPSFQAEYKRLSVGLEYQFRRVTARECWPGANCPCCDRGKDPAIGLKGANPQLGPWWRY